MYLIFVTKSFKQVKGISGITNVVLTRLKAFLPETEFSSDKADVKGPADIANCLIAKNHSNSSLWSIPCVQNL